MTLTDSNLFPNTVYTYRIIASNPFGASDYSDSLMAIRTAITSWNPNNESGSRRDNILATLLTWNSVGANYYKVIGVPAGTRWLATTKLDIDMYSRNNERMSC